MLPTNRLIFIIFVVNMMKFFSIIFSSLILVQSINISFEDFSKLNVLLEHAQFHQEKYGDSFFEFLAEHYGDEEYQPHNHKEHEELPFKHNPQTCTHLNIAFTINTVTFAIKNQPVLESTNNFFYKESHSVFEKYSIFQPPKLA